MTNLSGISIAGELDPAHILLEKAAAIYDQNSIKYLEPSQRITRLHEVQGTKQTRELSLEKGSLILKNQGDKIVSATDTELKLHYALQFNKLLWTIFLVAPSVELLKPWKINIWIASSNP